MPSVCVLGASGFLGRNLVDGTDWTAVTRADLDLLNQADVDKYFQENSYDVVVHCGVQGGRRHSADDGNVTHNNILMFENVVRAFKGKILYFSSGASMQGDPPTTPYALSKWIIDKRIETIDNAFSLRIWGCYGPGELPTRFSAVCRRDGHVVIDKDRYFDFVDIREVKKIVEMYMNGQLSNKCFNFVHPEKLLLSQWAGIFGATYEIENTLELGEPYCLHR